MDSERRERLERYKKRRRKHLYMVMSIVFVLFVLGLSLASIIKKDKTFSEQENRMLAEMPVLTVESIKNEAFMTGLEEYTADQFIGRDFWITVKTYSDLLLGKREFNGVYLCKDQYLMEVPSEPDTENVEENMEAVNAFASAHSDLLVNMMIVPNAAYVMSDYLPKGAPVRDQEQDMAWLGGLLSTQVGFINVTDALKEHEDEGLYYKTDHHWTSKGAMYGFEAAAPALQITDPVKAYSTYTVSTTFEGTMASTSGYHAVKDSIEVYAPSDTEVKYIVSDSDNAEKRTTIYDTDALGEKDQYQVFFGGNHSLVDISTVNETDRKLLIFKDSYANCFVPFLLPYYSEIIMVDPRYYYDNVDMVIENYAITDVLFLYNMDTFMTDNSLADVLATSAEAAESPTEDTEATPEDAASTIGETSAPDETSVPEEA